MTAKQSKRSVISLTASTVSNVSLLTAGARLSPWTCIKNKIWSPYEADMDVCRCSKEEGNGNGVSLKAEDCKPSRTTISPPSPRCARGERWARRWRKVQEIKRIRWGGRGGWGETRWKQESSLALPLGCSCQGSGEADIIHLIGSHCYT